MAVSQDSQNLAALLPTGHQFATSFAITTCSTERPSYLSPFAPDTSLGPNFRYPRLHLKLNTSLPASKPQQLHNLLPAKHSNFVLYCRTAPVAAPSYILQQQHATRQTRKAHMHREAFIVCGSDTPLRPAQPSSHHISRNLLVQPNLIKAMLAD